MLPKTRPARASYTLAALLVAAGAWVGAPGRAHAEDVRGQIKFDPDKLGSPPVRNQGFVERIENPLRPVQKFAPWPYMVVVLEGGTVDDEAKKPPATIQNYELRGESFESPLFPVIVGARIQLVNKWYRERTLLTPDEPELVDSVTLNPRGVHEFKVTKAHQSILIRAEDSDHLEARVVGFADRYFALVDSRGRFEIKDVPEGTWQARVWYRDGFLDGVAQSVEVGKKRTEFDLTLTPDKVRGAKQ